MFQHSLGFALVVSLASGGLAAAQPEAEQQPAETLPTDEPEPNTLALWFAHAESDNIGRTVIPEDGSYDGLGLLGNLGYMSNRLAASVNADLEYRTYSLDTLDSEVVGTLNAGAVIDIIEDRFTWTFNDYFGQGITDPFAGIGPGNRNQINVIATGPKVDLPLGALTTLALGSTLSQRRFGDSPNVDSDSTLFEIGLSRQISTTARLGIAATADSIDYVDVLAPQYDIDKLSIQYEKELASGRVHAELGTNEISAAGFKENGSLYDFLWVRSLTPRSDLSIVAAQEFTDAGGALVDVLAPGLEVDSFTDVVVVPNPLEQQRLVLSYVLTMSRTVIGAYAGSFQEEYVGNTVANNDWVPLNVSLRRTISPRLGIGFDFGRLERQFSNNPQLDGEESWTSLWVRRTFGRRLFLAFAILDYERSAVDSYDEQRYEFRFGYSPTNNPVGRVASTWR